MCGVCVCVCAWPGATVGFSLGGECFLAGVLGGVFGWMGGVVVVVLGLGIFNVSGTNLC